MCFRVVHTQFSIYTSSLFYILQHFFSLCTFYRKLRIYISDKANGRLWQSCCVNTLTWLECEVAQDSSYANSILFHTKRVRETRAKATHRERYGQVLQRHAKASAHEVRKFLFYAEYVWGYTFWISIEKIPFCNAAQKKIAKSKNRGNIFLKCTVTMNGTTESIGVGFCCNIEFMERAKNAYRLALFLLLCCSHTRSRHLVEHGWWCGVWTMAGNRCYPS